MPRATKSYFKLPVILPAVTGVIAGAALFLLGLTQDAPGACVLGLAAAFLMILWGVRNTGTVRKGLLTGIAFLCFGAGGALLSVVLLLDGEFEDKPWIAAIGVAVGIVLIILSVRQFFKMRGKS